ncbi:MAG: hypothetical protein B7X76_07335, partial [Azorhizobium sp. 39-67-5]
MTATASPGTPGVLGAAIKDALISAVLTALLLTPLVGFRATEDGGGPLILTYRFGLVAIFAGIVAVLRLVLN